MLDQLFAEEQNKKQEQPHQVEVEVVVNCKYFIFICTSVFHKLKIKRSH